MRPGLGEGCRRIGVGVGRGVIESEDVVRGFVHRLCAEETSLPGGRWTRGAIRKVGIYHKFTHQGSSILHRRYTIVSYY